jgi:cysteine-rich repeat protein
VCNGRDDDCGGEADDLAAEPCELAAEEDQGCGFGRTQCVGDAPACVAVPSEEVCNGRDDDCDLSVDEECVAPCGNGQLDAGEACDGTPECTPDCQIGYCGDGVVTAGEDCDAGPGGDSGKTCTTDCLYIECGDGIVYAGVEDCDDGTAVGEDDGCLACVVTAGWSCDSTAGETSVCSAVCGDGKIVGPETCDDDNEDGGDGCSSSCTEEFGFDCTTSLLGVNACEPICGDGVIVKGEGCDDDDDAAGDGCSPSCEVEPDWTCSTTIGASVCVRRCDAPGADECPPSAVCDSVTGACVPL